MWIQQLDADIMWLRTAEAAALTHETVVERLRVDPSHGLSWAEAGVRQKVYGTNSFEVKDADPLWKKYLEQVSRPPPADRSLDARNPAVFWYSTL